MIKSVFHISKMDCPSEENLVRMKLEGISAIKKLEFNLEKRELSVFHHSVRNNEIETRLEDLNLGTTLLESSKTNEQSGHVEKQESKLLWIVLLINFGFFVIEMGSGFLANSMGLVADSLDMLADSIVYGLSLWAVGAALSRKKRVATLSGYFQITLAVIGLMEIIRRFVGNEAIPDFKTMIIVSVLALVANSVCLYLLQKTKSSDAHIKASMIFTSNDVIINTGVILAGVLVLLTHSKYPDLIIGSVVFLVVVKGAFRILKLGK